MTVDLTRLEIQVLHLAAQSVAEDIDSYGLTGAEKRAFFRVLDKLQAVLRAEKTVSSADHTLENSHG